MVRRKKKGTGNNEETVSASSSDEEKIPEERKGLLPLDNSDIHLIGAIAIVVLLGAIATQFALSSDSGTVKLIDDNRSEPDTTLDDTIQDSSKWESGSQESGQPYQADPVEGTHQTEEGSATTANNPRTDSGLTLSGDPELPAEEQTAEETTEEQAEKDGGPPPGQREEPPYHPTDGDGDGIPPPTGITSCGVIDEPGSYQLLTDLTGAPVEYENGSFACIVVQSDNTYFDCSGHSITNDGSYNASGYVIDGASSSVNCPYVFGYDIEMPGENDTQNDTSDGSGDNETGIDPGQNDTGDNETGDDPGGFDPGQNDTDDNQTGVDPGDNETGIDPGQNDTGDNETGDDPGGFDPGGNETGDNETGIDPGQNDTNVTDDDPPYTGCVDFSDPATYDGRISIVGDELHITEDIGFCGGSEPPDGSRIVIDSPGVTLDCAGSQLTGDNGDGILIHGVDNVIVRNCRVEGFENSIKVDSASGSTFRGITINDAENGLMIENSDNNLFENMIIRGNSENGIYMDASDGNSFDNILLYGNEMDLLFNNSMDELITYTLNDLEIRTPSGSDIHGYTRLEIEDDLAPGASYHVSWTSPPGALGEGHVSFRDRFVEITTLSGSVSIDRISWTWAGEEGDFNESELELWRFSHGEWTLLSDNPDIYNDMITVYDLIPASDYGLLQSGAATAVISGDVGLYGADVDGYSHLDRWEGRDAGNTTTEGGNITEVNLSGDFLTDRWAAFFGNISGDIILADNDSGFYVYSWTYDAGSDVGTVCASTYDSFSTLAARGANGSEIDTAWGFAGTATDSGENTFSQNDCIMGIGTTFIDNASYVDTGPAGGFITCALRVNETASLSKDDLFFCSNATTSTNYRNEPADFEIMVPTNNSVGETETYYFYANFN